LGGLPCAAKACVQKIINTMANAAVGAATMGQVILALSFISLFPFAREILNTNKTKIVVS
jgi:hypothetical protein